MRFETFSELTYEILEKTVNSFLQDEMVGVLHSQVLRPKNYFIIVLTTGKKTDNPMKVRVFSRHGYPESWIANQMNQFLERNVEIISVKLEFVLHEFQGKQFGLIPIGQIIYKDKMT